MKYNVHDKSNRNAIRHVLISRFPTERDLLMAREKMCALKLRITATHKCQITSSHAISVLFRNNTIASPLLNKSDIKLHRKTRRQYFFFYYVRNCHILKTQLFHIKTYNLIHQKTTATNNAMHENQIENSKLRQHKRIHCATIVCTHLT